MARKPKGTLTKKRQAELKRKYRTGESIGKAIIQFFVEEMSNPSEGEAETTNTTLTIEEINFLEKNLEDNGPDRERFIKYYNYYSIIKAQQHWVDHYTQRYYRGFFKILALLQSTEDNLENLNLLESSLLKHNEETEKLLSKSRERFRFDLKAIHDLLVRNLKIHVMFAFLNLSIYNIMLNEIEEHWELGISPIIPDMKVHEKEFLRLQERAERLTEGIKNYGNIEFKEEALSALKFLREITISQMKPTKEEKELHIQKIHELMNFRLDMILNTSFDTNKFSISL